jgi:hypothetical protein
MTYVTREYDTPEKLPNGYGDAIDFLIIASECNLIAFKVRMRIYYAHKNVVPELP